MGLRTKTALVIAGTAAIVATLIGLLVHQLTAEDQRESAAHAVDARLVEAVSAYASGIDSGALVNSPELPAALRKTVTDRPVRATCLQSGGGSRTPVLWAATRSGRDILAVRRSYAPQARALADLDRVLVGSGASVTALGCVLGIVAAAGTGRRITASAHTAQRIADGDLTDRVRPKGKDDIARLGAAVNTMADALSARLEAERQVTADIAHELRTPVADLVTAVGLLARGSQRFRTGARERGASIGLGLTIVTGQARVRNARVAYVPRTEACRQRFTSPRPRTARDVSGGRPGPTRQTPPPRRPDRHQMP